MLCDFMGVMFLVYPADAPNKRGEDKQASIKKAWAMHGIHRELLKKSRLLSMWQLINKWTFFSTISPCEYIRFPYSHYYYMMTIKRYYSNISTMDAMNRLLYAGTCPCKNSFFSGIWRHPGTTFLSTNLTNSFPLKRESTGIPIVVASKEF